jgi:hypothetical protein
MTAKKQRVREEEDRDKINPSKAHSSDPLPSVRPHFPPLPNSTIMNPSMDLPIDEVSALMIQSLPKSPTFEC